MRVFRVDYPEIVPQLIELFADSTPPLLDELRAVVESGDEESVRRVAHKLKGSCQNIGAGFMAKLAANIERAATAAPAELEGLDRVFADTRDALRAALLEDDGVMDVVLLVLAAVAIVTAVLARRAAARAIVSERRYRELAAQWPDSAIGLIDRDLRFTLFEGDALAPFWTADEVLGKTVLRGVPAGSRRGGAAERPGGARRRALDARVGGRALRARRTASTSSRSARTTARSRTRCSRSATSRTRRRSSSRSRSSAGS